MAIRSACALSLMKARGLRPRGNALLISILGQSEASSHRRPQMGGWRSVLQLEFEDVSEEAALALPGDWPLEPSAEDNLRMVGEGRGVAPAMSHARAVVEFLDRHHRSPEPLDLIVHCFAGMSRSVQVAAKAARWFDLPERDELQSRLIHANPRLGRLLQMAKIEAREGLEIKEQDIAVSVPSLKLIRP